MACAVTTAFAETETTITGQIRLRDEMDKRQFDPDNNHMKSFSELRTRVQVEAIVDGNAHAVVQFQDSRELGGQNVFGQNVSGTTNDDEGVGIHQAYVQVDRIAVDGLGAKAGRFEFNLGNQRVFGAVGWSNVGRSWEGGQFWFDHEQFNLKVFGLKAIEKNNDYDNQDFDIFGGQFSLKSFDWDVFAFYEYNADTTNLFYGINSLERFNIGTYYYRMYRNIDFTGNFNYQAGKIPAGQMPLSQTDLDIRAFMFTAEAGLNLEGSANARFAVGVDYSSGDDDPTDSTYHTYDNAYYTGHKFRGAMDYFVSSQTAGLVDFMLRGRFDPAPMWTIAADVHLFSTAKDYTDYMGEMTKDVGSEIDLSVTTSVIQGINFKAGASVFMAKESFAGFADPDPGFWGYTMTTLNF
jgi:hypothetical protein